MFDFKWFTGLALIFIYNNIRFSLANKQNQPEFNLVYKNSFSDSIQFTVRSEHDRYHINAVTCGTSTYIAANGGRTALITSLKSCKLYDCKVEVTNKFSFEKFILIERVTTGFDSKTYPIKVVKVVPETYSIRVELDFQEIDCIDSFYIVLDNSRAIFLDKSNLTRVLTISKLSPCVKYHLYIFFNHFSGPQPILNENVQTSAMKLTRIRNVKFNPKTEHLTWDSVLFDDCSSTYVITVVSETNGDTLFFESMVNEYNLNMLGGCSKYLINVKPKAHDTLFGTAIIETKFKMPRSPVQQFQVRLLSKTTTLSIEWRRPNENSNCNIQYAVQVNGVWTITTFLKHLVPICSNSQSYNMSVCLFGLQTAHHCVNYSYDINLNKLVEPEKQTAEIFMHIPPMYRSIGWGSITMNDFNDTDALLHINETITSLPNSKLLLSISELKCGRNLVPSYKIFDQHNVDDKCTNVLIDGCTKVCEFNKIPNELELNISEGISFSCNSGEPNRLTLKRGVAYKIMARIYTQNGYTDTTPIVFPKDLILANRFDLFLHITIPVVGSILLIIVVVIGLICKNRYKAPDRTFAEVQNFKSFYKKIDSDFVQREFQSINELDFSHLAKTVSNSEMLGKNRFTDVIPYDYNRVSVSTGYINASYIDGYKREKQYIAAQGPTEKTLFDFWHMIVEQKCDGIVMLTNLSENGIVQCYKYYPNINESVTIKDITITNVEEIDYGQFIKRILQTTKGRVNRYFVQYQYVIWHNGNCPENGLDLVEFVENTGALNSESPDPILVHSSAGTGRTGTFIALDLLIQQSRKEKYISVCNTVKKLRSQRCRMVETVGQYRFLYDCVNNYNLICRRKRKYGYV